MKKINRYLFYLILLLAALWLSGCSSKKSEKEQGSHYEVVDGQIVEVEGSAEGTDGTDGVSGDVIMAGDYDPNAAVLPGEYASSTVSDGTAMNFADEEYNSIDQADRTDVSLLKEQLNAAADACREVYANADKGEARNVTLSDATIAELVSCVGTTGVPCVDSLMDCNMAAYETLDEFGQETRMTGGYLKGTYIQIYPDGHMTIFCLCRENNIWHLLAVSGEWEANNAFRIFSEGRYSVGGVSYTERGWLIYTRNTEDFDDNQKKNTGSYTMVRVLPYDSTARALSKTYIEPVSYLENNLFITNWSEADMSAIDFNSLYAYVFGLYNGTEMLSSYNVRKYYKSYHNTRLYVVPTDIFENNTQVYFRIDSSTLRNISDYSAEAGGYFFLGYNRDYYNVIPRTPSPEVESYTYNNDGTITMRVAAVNTWYGTDTAFEHILTVRPGETAFEYVSNELIASENNILPEQKLSELLDVEKKKLE